MPNLEKSSSQRTPFPILTLSDFLYSKDREKDTVKSRQWDTRRSFHLFIYLFSFFLWEKYSNLASLFGFQPFLPAHALRRRCSNLLATCIWIYLANSLMCCIYCIMRGWNRQWVTKMSDRREEWSRFFLSFFYFSCLLPSLYYHFLFFRSLLPSSIFPRLFFFFLLLFFFFFFFFFFLFFFFLLLLLLLLYRLIGLAGRVFANGPGDLGLIPGRVIPKTFKMILDTSLLNTQEYKVHIKGKVKQSRELRPPLYLGVVAIEKGAFWSPSTTVANFTFY